MQSKHFYFVSSSAVKTSKQHSRFFEKQVPYTEQQQQQQRHDASRPAPRGAHPEKQPLSTRHANLMLLEVPTLQHKQKTDSLPPTIAQTVVDRPAYNSAIALTAPPPPEGSSSWGDDSRSDRASCSAECWLECRRKSKQAAEEREFFYAARLWVC